MQFNSFQYIFLLFITVGIYYLLPLLGQKLLLVIVSFGFYMAWNVKYSLLMATVILLTYFAAIFMIKKPQYKRLLFFGSLLSVLGLLFYFKYFNFFLDTLNQVFGANFSMLNIILPVGISFYVFQSIGYLADVYTNNEECEKSLLNYALFISFFPQLVAGPIERSKNMLTQFNTKQVFDVQNIKNGLTLVLVGLVQKVVIADRLALYVNAVFANYQQASRAALIVAVVFFAFQVYCDFNAYSLIAIGSAKTMGYTLMRNFNHPYLSRSFAEYWSRWHISLSTWFQDYIFTPFVWTNPLKKLGKFFTAPPMVLGLLLVFTVSGFWHGASWTFVVWGLLHGAFRIFEALTAKSKKKFYKKHAIRPNHPILVVVEVAIVFLLNCFTYVFFRADSMGQAMGYIKGILFGTGTNGIYSDILGVKSGEITLCFVIIGALVLLEILGEIFCKNISFDVILQQKNVVVQSVVYAALLLILVVFGMYGVSYVENPFIYFQF